MSTSKSKSEIHDLFQSEYDVIGHAKDLLASSDNSKVDVKEFEVILKGFSSTLKKLEKIIRIHDRQQHEISRLSDKLSYISKQTSRYIPQQVYEAIFSKENQSEFALAVERKKMAVFFSDIVNFSEITQDIEPELLALTMNTYLNEMFNIAKEYGGTIDKTIGDALLIFFGAPKTLGEKEDALACVKMAIAMRKSIHKLEVVLQQHGITKPIKVRMAIHSGFCTVGNFGNKDRMDYTIIGNPVNLASRLQNEAENNQILITQEVFMLIQDEIYCEKKNSVFVKGFHYPIICYEVFDLYKNMKKPNDISAFSEGFSVYFNKKLVSKDKTKEILTTLNKIIDTLKGS